jgi:predicted nucleic acid-binding protein
VIYLDTSVVLAELLAEDLRQPEGLWSEVLASSRLLEYEVWNRLHARASDPETHDRARSLLEKVAFLEMSPPILARALEPLPVTVRTLDGLHLASMVFLRSLRQRVRLATFDVRLAAAAKALDIEVLPFRA